MRVLCKVLLLIVLLGLPSRAEGLSLRLMIYNPGKGPVRFTLKVENLTGAPICLTQPSSQTHDISVSHDGSEVWRWSADKFFMQSLAERVFKPSETVTYTGDWDRLDRAGRPVPPGKFTVKAWLPVVEGQAPSVSRSLSL